MNSTTAVLRRRRAGVLLHVSSLAAGLGSGGRAFIDWLASAGFSVWQILPLGPTGADGSPYWVRSDAAGNAALIDPGEPAPLQSSELQDFLAGSSDWLDDYAAFEVLSSLHHGAPWWTWPPQYRDRQPAALAQLRREQSQALDAIREQQFTFAWQWQRLHEYARSQGVHLFGDVPFYVAPHSVEAWANRGQFQLDATGRPVAVAGVPPDYFSKLGQLWGNPLYDWDAMQQDGFRFWRARIRRQLQRVDLLRIDHFRALAAHWAVPAGAPDAARRCQPWPTACCASTVRSSASAAISAIATPFTDFTDRADRLPPIRGGSRRSPAADQADPWHAVMARHSLRSQLYRVARDLGNVQAASRGPGAYATRMARRKVYRTTNGMTRHLLRALGL